MISEVRLARLAAIDLAAVEIGIVRQPHDGRRRRQARERIFLCVSESKLPTEEWGNSRLTLVFEVGLGTMVTSEANDGRSSGWVGTVREHLDVSKLSCGTEGGAVGGLPSRPAETLSYGGRLESMPNLDLGVLIK